MPGTGLHAKAYKHLPPATPDIVVTLVRHDGGDDDDDDADHMGMQNNRKAGL